MDFHRSVGMRYALFQIPDLILFGLALTAAVHWWGLSATIAYVIFALWIAKDILMFPLLRVAYERASQKHDRLTGALGVARESLDPFGYVAVGSELWNAEPAPGIDSIRAGTRIRVVGLEGLILVVEPVDDR